MSILGTSARMERIRPSATIMVTMKAMELRAAGRDIVSLSAGEPDFDTPAHIRDAAITAIEDGQTRYTAVDGTPEVVVDGRTGLLVPPGDPAAAAATPLVALVLMLLLVGMFIELKLFPVNGPAIEASIERARRF